VIFNRALPDELPFINALLKKKGLQELVNYTWLRYGNDVTVQMVDSLKDLGFSYATRAGISIGIDDMVIPEQKDRLVEDARRQQIEVEQQYRDGAITKRRALQQGRRDLVRRHRPRREAMFKQMRSIDDDPAAEFNSVYIMADSAPRGSKQQMRQLAGMRGLMAKPSGEIIETRSPPTSARG